MRSIETSKESHAAERAFSENDALMLRAVEIGKTFTLHGQGGV
jgi:alpha-D-ribose 1-methylphosphonate 5-triphosphate synthase subunit PhnL